MPLGKWGYGHPWEALLGRRAVGQIESFVILTPVYVSPLLMTYFFHQFPTIYHSIVKFNLPVVRSWMFSLSCFFPCSTPALLELSTRKMNCRRLHKLITGKLHQCYWQAPLIWYFVARREVSQLGVLGGLQPPLLLQVLTAGE